MPNININVGKFDCTDTSSPFALQVTIGTTYRNGNDYLLNYNWNSSLYDSFGMTTEVILTYVPDGMSPVLYGTLPDNADNYLITLPTYDQLTLFFEFRVNGGSQCFVTRNVLYSEIVITS